MRAIAPVAAVVFGLMAGILIAPYDPPYGQKILVAVASAAVAVIALTVMPGSRAQCSGQGRANHPSEHWQRNKMIQLGIGLLVAAGAHLAFEVTAPLSAIYAIVSGIFTGAFLSDEQDDNHHQ